MSFDTTFSVLDIVGSIVLAFFGSNFLSSIHDTTVSNRRVAPALKPLGRKGFSLFVITCTFGCISAHSLAHKSKVSNL